MSKVRKKKFVEYDVLTAAIKRVEDMYDRFDNVVVSFSGGKDSTAVLAVVKEVAKRRGKLPVRANFFDEEIFPFDTADYVKRINEDPDIDLRWYCLPIKHRNACSNKQPFWYCWNPEKKDLWVRPMPENAITEHPSFIKGMSIKQLQPEILKHEYKGKGTVCLAFGFRTQEALRRYMAIATKKNESYIARATISDQVLKSGKLVSRSYNFLRHASPVYDWSSVDVWRLVDKWGLDYNKAYDVMNRTGFYNRLLDQRVSAAFGEQPLRQLWMYAECWPEQWERMIKRLPGVATAARYANTELYIKGEKPEDLSFEDYTNALLDTYSGDAREHVSNHLQKVIKYHYRRSRLPLTADTPDPVSGVAWSILADFCKKGDFKGRYFKTITRYARATREKLGIDLLTAVAKFGTKEYFNQMMKAEKERLKNTKKND